MIIITVTANTAEQVVFNNNFNENPKTALQGAVLLVKDNPAKRLHYLSNLRYNQSATTLDNWSNYEHFY